MVRPELHLPQFAHGKNKRNLNRRGWGQRCQAPRNREKLRVFSPKPLPSLCQGGGERHHRAGGNGSCPTSIGEHHAGPQGKTPQDSIPPNPPHSPKASSAPPVDPTAARKGGTSHPGTCPQGAQTAARSRGEERRQGPRSPGCFGDSAGLKLLLLIPKLHLFSYRECCWKHFPPKNGPRGMLGGNVGEEPTKKLYFTPHPPQKKIRREGNVLQEAARAAGRVIFI